MSTYLTPQIQHKPYQTTIISSTTGSAMKYRMEGCSHKVIRTIFPNLLVPQILFCTDVLPLNELATHHSNGELSASIETQ
jgi:hypothetical protein